MGGRRSWSFCNLPSGEGQPIRGGEAEGILAGGKRQANVFPGTSTQLGHPGDKILVSDGWDVKARPHKCSIPRWEYAVDVCHAAGISWEICMTSTQPLLRARQGRQLDR